MDRAKIYNRSAAILLIKRHAVKDYNLTGVMFLPKSREGDVDGDCCILIVFLCRERVLVDQGRSNNR